MPIDATISPAELEVIEKASRIDYEPMPAKVPTDTPLGSRERLEVYRQRYLAGEDLYHPGDSKEFSKPCDGMPRAYVPGIKMLVVSGDGIDVA
jgi:hypothetical protein